jgi:uncharacterized protein YndB with AHSA1/START domain
MRKLTLTLLLAALAINAKVVDKASGGFHVEQKATVAADPARVYAAIVDVAKWWEASHSYSGDSANLSINAQPGGCFCERLPNGGGVQHGMVVYAAPGEMLRITGALGPLQSAGIAGALTFALKPSGTGTELTLSYVAGGYFPQGIEHVAGPADQMMAAQFARLMALLK